MEVGYFGAGTATLNLGYLRPLRVRSSRRINQDGTLQLYVELVGRVEQKRRTPSEPLPLPPQGEISIT